MDAQDSPPVEKQRLQELLADVQTMADDHEEAGREPVIVPPVEVSVLDGTPFGLEVVAPPDAFNPIEDVVESATLDTSHVYRTDVEGARLLIVLLEGTLPDDGDDGPADVSVFVPAYLPLPATALAERAREEGVMYTHVRPPDGDARVTFTHDDPTLFF